MSETSKPHSNPDADLLRAFIGKALTQGVDGYRADDLLGSVRRLEEQLATIEQERDDFEASQARLLHIIECADTPLMRDVLAERDGLKEQLEAALRIVDAARRARDNGDFRVTVETANIALGLVGYDERYPAKRPT